MSSRDRYRDRDRDRNRERDRDRDRHRRRRSGSRDRHGHSSEHKRRSRSRSPSSHLRPAVRDGLAAVATAAAAAKAAKAAAAAAESEVLRTAAATQQQQQLLPQPQLPKPQQGPRQSKFELEGAVILGDGPIDREAEARRLELEMQKRRERIERERAERERLRAEAAESALQQPLRLPSAPSGLKPPPPLRRKLGDSNGVGAGGNEESGDEALLKKAKAAEDAEDDDVDPLDAYMAQLQKAGPQKQEPKSATAAPLANSAAAGTGSGPRVTIIRATSSAAGPGSEPQSAPAGTAKSASSTRKGELMEADADGLEYSSEEEEQTLEEALMARTGSARKEKLISVDHSKIEYAPFTRAFYRECPEVAEMTPEAVAELRRELGGIQAKGRNCPKPVRDWAQAGLSSNLLNLLRHYKFDKPTPIQCQALPIALSGRDMIGIAATGSGKTLAFLLPLLVHIRAQPPLEAGEGPMAVVMTPTRELALQIFKEAKRFAKHLRLRVVCVYGGTGISEQIAELKRGCEIVVCTPGRMIDMLAANAGRVTNLRRTTFCVLDEADRMFDMGFEPQVMKIVESIRPDRQTLMFSATFPRQMEILARKVLDSPIEVVVGGRAVVCSEVQQEIILLTEDDKFFKLLELLGVYQERGGCLIFVDRQEKADELMKLLMKHAYPCLSLHGGIDQYDRDSVITAFKRGDARLLIATSVAARGLDVTGLILVVNYDCPNHYEDYVHRCGRTGRAGNKGHAVTFITRDQEKHAGDLIWALKLAQANVPANLQALWDAYVQRMEAEGKPVRSASGFTRRCKGYAFDDEESRLAKDRKKLQKASMGLQDSDDEADNIDDHIEELFAPRQRVKNVAPGAPTASSTAASTSATLTSAAASAVASSSASNTVAVSSSQSSAAPSTPAAAAAAAAAAAIAANWAAGNVGGGAAPVGSAASAVPDVAAAAAAAEQQPQNKELQRKLQLAKQRATLVNLGRQEDQQQAAATAMRGSVSLNPSSISVSSKTLANQMAERLNVRLGYRPAEETPVEAEETTVKRYEVELEINDFPQNVRWRLTSREFLGNLSELCDVGISVRGAFMPQRPPPPPTPEAAEAAERPLYLLVESLSDMNIQNAKKEITRVVKEELLRLQSSTQLNRLPGRYKVL
ncbi:hypothetical protein BOX15_Mlig032033g2 [Macrostomum lignano]|uniref:Uncharacterized protein n=3 Tax=Macrostomum lignano TaxID=282301 RepID=A0A267DET0_9PLAT|nr:hypothetical protein BOX15_Mlig032033g2 [Macrostomum lignano]